MPTSALHIPPGRFVSSHSMRKTGASAANKVGVTLFEGLMPWGGWRSSQSAERYVNQAYLASADGIFADLFDWLRPRN